jgi:hypothetical protein
VDNLTFGRPTGALATKTLYWFQANPSLARIFGYASPENDQFSIVELYASSEERMHFLEEIKQKGVVSNHEVLMKKKGRHPHLD